MRVAGICLLLIFILFFFEASIFNQFKSNLLSEDTDDLVDKIKLIGGIQLILLMVAGISLIAHGAMSRSIAERNFTELKNRINRMEKTLNPDLEIHEENISNNQSNINEILGI